MHHRSYAIVEAPSILGLKPTGVDQLPQALLRHSLAQQLKARLAARTPAFLNLPSAYGATLVLMNFCQNRTASAIHPSAFVPVPGPKP